VSSKKVKFGKVPVVYPIPVILAGALVNGKPNFATLGDVGIMGINPPIVYISSGSGHYTNQGILENGTFSINFPTTRLLPVTDYCGTVSGRDVDKSKLFDVFFGESGTAPMIRECPVNLECKVIKEFSIQQRQIIVGEVLQAYVNEEFVVESEGRLNPHARVVEKPMHICILALKHDWDWLNHLSAHNRYYLAHAFDAAAMPRFMQIFSRL